MNALPKGILFLSLLLTLTACEPPLQQELITTDIDNFWRAYDQVVSTNDSLAKVQLLNEVFIDAASPGQESMMQVRNYSPEEYLSAVQQYPRFWESIRKQTTTVHEHFPAIEDNIRALRKTYPALQLAPIYFTVGLFRSGGTVHDGKVLIGSELSLANAETVIGELPEWRQPFYQDAAPVDDLPLLCAHEYIHTQQHELQEDLLMKCMYEGVAEFVSCLATKTPSASPAIAFGQANQERVIERFVKDMFSGNNDFDWLWGENDNELQVRDLGYYVGYEICERYYQQAEDKAVAIAELIELDYTQFEKVEAIVNSTGVLPKPVAELRAEYEARRPSVTEILEFNNGASGVDPALKRISVRFSEKLNGYHAGIDYGPLGEAYCPKMDPFSRAWAADSLGYSVAVSLEPKTRYQFTISSNFRNAEGVRIQPYIIEFETGE